MASRVSVRPYTSQPAISVIIVPGPSGSFANILMGADLLGNGVRPPVGRLGLRLRRGDLVGLTPPAAALKALHHVVRTLEHIVGTAGTAKPPEPPGGATGAKNASHAETAHVPGQLTLF